MLKNPRVLSCFMIKTPLKLMNRSMTTPFFFMGIISISYILLLLCIFPCKNILNNLIIYIVIINTMAWFVIDTALIGLSFLFFLLSACKDPGYLQKPKKISFLVNIFLTKHHFRLYYKTLIQYYCAQTVK